MEHFDIASSLLARRGAPIGDLIPADPQSESLLDLSQQLPAGLPHIALAKQFTDKTAREEFLSGQISSVELSQRMTRAYERHVIELVESSGFGELLRSQGYALASFGGFARENVGMRSDWDMMVVNERGGPDLSHPVLLQFCDLMRYGIEAKFLVRESSMLPGMLEDPKGQGIVSLTALLKMSLLAGDQENLDILGRSRDQLLTENYTAVVQLLDRSIREREKHAGILFRLAEFDFKDARGGLRDRDCIRWLDEIATIVHKQSLLSPADHELLQNIDEVMLTAKHALHFSSEGVRPSQSNSFSNGRRERVIEVFGRSARELLPPLAVYDFIFSTSRQVHTLLNRVLQQAYALGADGGADISVPAAQPLLPRTRKELGECLKSGLAVAPVIRGLFESGDLGRLIPDFAYAQYFVDRAGFHRFPLGEHQVRAVEELSRLLFEVREGRPVVPDITFPVDVAPLYLALLLHDVSKPDEGDARDHHLRGARIAHQVALDLGFSEPQAARTRQLVEDHMLISNISSHIEVADLPEVMATRISGLDYLQELLLLTLADKRESNPHTWRLARQDRLINAYETIKLGMVAPEGHADIYNFKVQHVLTAQGVPFAPDDVRSIVSKINPRVLNYYAVEVLAEKVRMLLELKNNPEQAQQEDLFKVKLILPEREDAPLALYIACRDSLGLLGRVSSYLDRRSMVLKSALVDTHDGIACDYLTFESRLGKLKFLPGDDTAFINGLRREIFDQSSRADRKASKPSWLQGATFTEPIEVKVRDDRQNGSISVIIQHAVHTNILSSLSPLLVARGLDIINAQIGCGNREIRHRLDLRSVAKDSPDLKELSEAIISALKTAG